MKKRILSLLLTLVMLVGMIPATTLPAFAAAADSVWVGGVEMTNGTYLANGATKTHTTKPSGGYAYYKDGTLTLNNYSYEGKGYQYSEQGWYATVYAEHDLTVELVGTNTLTQTAEQQSDVICVGGLVSNPDLTVDGNGKLIGTADDGMGLNAHGDITINGGTIAVTTYYAGIMSWRGYVIINGGDIIAESKLKDAVGIYAGYDVMINGGNVTAISANQAIGYGRSVTIAKDLIIRASTTADGELGEYVAANHTTYKKIVITPKPEINNVSVNGTSVADGATYTSNSKNVTIKTTYDSVMSDALTDYGCTVKKYGQWYLNGEKLNVAAVTPVDNGDGTSSETLYRTLNYGDVLEIRNWLEVKWPDGTTDIVDEHTASVVIDSAKFTTQPQGGTVAYNKRHITNWATNFEPVKQEQITYSPTGNVVMTQELNAGASLASLSYLSDGYYYRIRSYYDYSSDAYVESDKVYVTPDQYYTPNFQHGNEDGDIIAGITYVPNGDGTFNANVHIDLEHVDGQMLQYYWVSTGYYWYDHNNKVNYGIGTTDTSRYLFTLYNLGENLEPGKEWKVKVYLADDPYADYEWRDVDFHYVTDTVPELKPEDAVTTSLTVNCIGDIDYTVSGNVVTVDHEVACKVGYLDGTAYKAIAAVANGNGTYSFTAPAGVTEVLLVVKGDVSGDGRVNMGDVSKLYAHIKGTNMLTGVTLFMADISDDGRINMGDVSKLYAHIKGTNLLAWDT